MEFDLNCQVCDKVVGPSGAYLYVRTHDAQEAEEAIEEWHRQHPGPAYRMTEFFDFPSRAPWRVVHDQCEPEPEAAIYDIDIAQFQTYRDVLKWTAHLMGKTWFRFTNWESVIGRIAGPL